MSEETPDTPTPADDGPMVPKTRIDEKNRQIAALQQELKAANEKAGQLDAYAQQVTEWQHKAQQYQAERDQFRISGMNGITNPDAVGHMARTWAATMQGKPEGEHQSFEDWLPAIIQADRNSLDLTTRAVLNEIFSQGREEPRAIGTSPSPGERPPDPPLTTPPPVQTRQPNPNWPTSNNGVRPMPSEQTMSHTQIQEIIRDPKRFKEWRQNNPDQYRRYMKR